MPEEDEELWKKLPTDTKIQHKNWKARIDGYEQLKKIFLQADEKSPDFAKYQHLLKKFVVDSNAFAQEKGLEVVSVFVENASIAPKTAAEVVPVVITKGLGARAKAKEKTIEILLMYIEKEKHEFVIDELIKSFSHKTPKNAAAAIAVVRDALILFGDRVIPIKTIMKAVPNLFMHKEKLVRDEAKLLSIEMFKRVGAPVKETLSGIPIYAHKELEEEFSKVKVGEPCLPTRFLRSDFEYKAKIEAAVAKQVDATPTKSESKASTEVVIDPYETMESVEILSKVPADFFTQLADKKWSIRKDVLTTLKTLASVPKLESGEYGDIVRALKKVITKDTNVMVVIVAAECVAALSNGLRKKFATYSSFVFGGILERFREKKPTVVEALRSAADGVIRSNKLESFVEETLEQLESKSPNVKSETLLVWKRYLLEAKPAEMPKSLIKQLMPGLKKSMDESLAEIRDACYEVIVAIWMLAGEKNIMPFIDEIDKFKLDKIKEVYEKMTAPPVKPAEEADKSGQMTPGQPKALPAQGLKPPFGLLPSARQIPAVGALWKTLPLPVAEAGKKSLKETPREMTEREIDDGTVEVIREEHFSEEVRAKMDSLNWKERQEGMNEFKKKLALLEPETIPVQAFVRILAGKNNFKETNFNVMNQKFMLLSEVARLGRFTKTSFQICVQPLVDKIGDIKSGKEAKNALTEIAEKVGFPRVVEDVVNLSMNQKNPKNQSECFLWVAENIKLFGFKGLDSKLLCEKIKTSFLASNQLVRQAGFTLIGVMHIYLGPQVRCMFESEKAFTLQSIDAELEKVKDLKPDPPTRGLSVPKQTGPGGDVGNSKIPEEEEPEPEDLVPRVDISSKITEELLTKLAESRWKIREEGLNNVSTIIKEAAFVTPNLGNLVPALCKRLSDANKNLVCTAAGICSELAHALSPKGCKQHFKTFAPALIHMLADMKPSVRQSAVKALDDWLEKCPLSLVFEDEIALSSLKSTNVNLRHGLLVWLEKQMAVCKPLPTRDLIPCVVPMFTSLEDRNGDVRKAAQGVCLYFLAHAGYDVVFRQTSKLSPISQGIIRKQLEGMQDSIPDIKTRQDNKAPEVHKLAPVVSNAEPVPSVTSKPVPQSWASSESVSSVRALSGATSVAQTHTPMHSEPQLDMLTDSSCRKEKPSSTRSLQLSVRKPKKDPVEEDTTPPLIVGIGKESREQRLKDDLCHKLLKWNFDVPSRDHIQQLNEEMETVCSKSLHKSLFHSDFKFHLQAIDKLSSFLTPPNRHVVVANVDLILKWSSLRFFDSNPAVIFKVLDLIYLILKLCNDGMFKLSDAEASSFLPYMISLRIGDPKEEIRKKVHAIIKVLTSVYPGNKVFSHLVDGTKQKNSRGRLECLEAMGRLVEEFGISVCHPSVQKAVKDVANTIGDKDTTVRSAALSFLFLVVSIVGLEMTKRWMGPLPEKERRMFDERVKRSMKPSTDNDKNATESVQGSSEIVGMSHIKRIQRKKSSAPNSARQPAASGTTLMSQSANFDQSQSSVRSECLERPGTAVPAIQGAELININSNTDLKNLNDSNHSLQTSLQEVTRVLSLFMASFNDTDIESSCKTLGQIYHLLKDEEKNIFFQAQDLQKLVAITTRQLKVCVSHHLKPALSDSMKMKPLLQLMKMIMGTLFSLFSVKRLACLIRADDLYQLLTELIFTSRDSNFLKLAENEQFLKMVNDLICCIIIFGNRTSVIVTCLRLLRSAVNKRQPEWVGVEEIALKSCWKAMRDVVNGNEHVEILPILEECHLFLKAFPTSYWTKSAYDKPIRTVKTLLHYFAKSQGSLVLQKVKEVPNYHDSEVEIYLKKFINTLYRTGATAKTNSTVSRSGDTVEMKRTSRSIDDIIDDFIAKTTNESDTQKVTEFCHDFIRFKLSNPNADTSRFIAVLGPQNARWVKNIIENPYYEKTRDRIDCNVASFSKNLSGTPDAKPAEHYRKLLEKMKQQSRSRENEELLKRPRHNKMMSSSNIVLSKVTSSDDMSSNEVTPRSHYRPPLKNKSCPMSDLYRYKKLPLPGKQSPTPGAEKIPKQRSQNIKTSPANYDSLSTSSSVDVAEFRKRLEMIKRQSNTKL